MAMIFPGMDPYLEDPALWTGVHASLVVYIRNYLQPLLRPRYVAAVEERVFLEFPPQDRIPDVWVKRSKKAAKTGTGVALMAADPAVVVKVPELEVHESYVAILDLYSGQQLVTVIEVVSPTNKFDGQGRESYLAKQKEIRGSTVHLVEIDLLRTGRHVLAVPEWIARGQGAYHYLAGVNRAQGCRDKFDLYPRQLPERLPRVAVPLAGKDPDVVLDVQAVLAQTYEDGSYADRVDYRARCRPPLPAEGQRWANAIIKKAKARSRRPGKGIP
jgi:hypothetical protein